MASNFVSPNEMLDAAVNMMLDGKDPVSKRDWEIVMNFFALNVHPEVAESACPLMAKIFNMPLTKSEVNTIVQFQLSRERRNDA